MLPSAVYVVAKAPRPGLVKTRLSPRVSLEQAASLARAFLLDTLLLARHARHVVVRAVCRDPAEAAIVRELGGATLEVLCQGEPGLGAALEECFYHGIADGFDRVAVLGSDSPTLPSELVEQAFATLDRHDVAIGPSEDGGYYLLAARALHPSLFRGMVWSTDTVFHETLARCRRDGLCSAILPSWYDVDTGDCLARLIRELDVASPGTAPNTRLALQAIASRPANGELPWALSTAAREAPSCHTTGNRDECPDGRPKTWQTWRSVRTA